MAESEDSGETTFKFSLKGSTEPFTITCDHSSEVLNTLFKDNDFQETFDKNKDTMDIVIQRQKIHRPAISVHFPSSLLENDEELKIRFIKRDSNPIARRKTRKQKQDLHLKPRQKLVTFVVNTTGGKGMKNILMENKTLKDEVSCVCVVGAKDDTVKAALRRDGRFSKELFTKDFALKDNENNMTKMKNPVKELKFDKLYTIVRNSTKAVTDSQELKDDPDDFDDQQQSSSKIDHVDSYPHSRNSTIFQSSSDKNDMTTEFPSTTSGFQNTTESKSSNKVKILGNIPNTEELIKILREQFADLVEDLKAREKVRTTDQVQLLLREEFSKKAQGFSKITTVKALMTLSDSVCQVLYGDDEIGTGFVLFDRFILTNAHVITCDKTLRDNLSVTFNYEVKRRQVNKYSLKKKPIAYHYTSNQQHTLDFALLELKNSGTVLPPPLLKKGKDGPILAPVKGAVCVIGHPDSDVKKMDICLIIERKNQNEEVEKFKAEDPDHIQLIGDAFFAKKKTLDGSQFEYHSCFFHGSSGSPVFDEQCNVVGMHTGGYVYEKEKEDRPNKTKKQFNSIMEYALPLLPILVSILRQTKIKRKDVWDAISDYSCGTLVKTHAENRTYKPDITESSDWDGQFSEDEDDDNSEPMDCV